MSSALFDLTASRSTTRRLAVGIAVVVGLLAGACSDDVIDLDAEGAQGEGSEQASSSTSSTEAPASTDAPATTESTTSTTTTTTTTLPGSGVIVGAEGVAGWSEGGEWRTLEDGALPAAPGDTYSVIYLTDPITTVAGGAPGPGCEFVDPSTDIDVGIEADTWPMPFPIAISANWDLVPHDVELLATDSTTYKDIASDLLFGQGVDDPDPTLVQLIRTDLEGDGVDEILVAAERNATGQLNPAAVGDYSIVFLRKLIEGEVQTAILGFSLVEEPPGEGWIIALDTLRFSAVADLNGDGQMEIVFTNQGYEGSSTVVMDYIDDDLGPLPVLSVGCGV